MKQIFYCRRWWNFQMKRIQSVHCLGGMIIVLLSMIVTPLRETAAADGRDMTPGRIILAQSSMGGSETPPQTSPIVPSPAPAPQIQPPSPQPNPSGGVLWGALAFTADGSWSTAWKESTRADAETSVLRRCAAIGHGGCEVAAISGQECLGLATFIGNYRRRRWLLSFTAGGATYPQAQAAAMDRCNADERSRGNCQFRTAVCADGR